MGNCTVAIKKAAPGISGAGVTKVVDITMSASYATGGDTVLLASLGLDSVDALVLTGNAAGLALEVVHGATPSTAPKIKVSRDNSNATYLQNVAFAEPAAATNFSTVVVRAIAYGNNPHI